MLLKTHLMFAFFAIILFVQQMNHPLIFAAMAVIATVLPDLDTRKSSFGRHLIFRPLQIIVQHRTIIHSFSFAILISILFAVFWPAASLGFFLGYSVHLLCDSFTKEGIQVFWPLKYRSRGFISSGGAIEESLFFAMLLTNIILFFLIIVK